MGVPDDHIQNQDVQVQIKGATAPVYIDASLNVEDGWRGGQWVQYTANSQGRFLNIRVVGLSTGVRAVGFLLRGSEFHPQVQQPGSAALRTSEYNFSSYQPRNTGVVTMCLDGSFLFKVFERYDFPNRTGGTEIVYTLSDQLFISERGLLTTFADATAAGIATPVWAGNCWMTPSATNEYRLGLDRF